MDDLEEEMHAAIEASSAAWSKYNHRKAAIIKTNMSWQERHDAEIAAIDELNASLETANARLRKVRSRPERALHLSKLRIVEKGFDDREADDAARARLIKILKPAMARDNIDPETALRDGIMLDRVFQDRHNQKKEN